LQQQNIPNSVEFDLCKANFSEFQTRRSVKGCSRYPTHQDYLISRILTQAVEPPIRLIPDDAGLPQRATQRRELWGTTETNQADSQDDSLLDVSETSRLLGVSESWVYRHASELPAVRIGAMLRFGRVLLLRQLRATTSCRTGSRLEPERGIQMRRYQQGTVFKQGKETKTWYGMWREDVRKPDGQIARRQRKIRLGTVSELPTRYAARTRLAELMGAKPAVEMTFAELVERWKTAVVPTLKSTTAANYQHVLRARVVPTFGEMQVRNMGRYEVELFLAENAKMYCRNTLRGMRASLSGVMSWAVRCGWLEKNPCSGVKLPMAGKKVIRAVLRPEQTIALANRLNEPYSTLVLFLATTGLRVGEAVGIKWSDFDGDVLHVCRRIYDRKEGSLKSERAERSLPIPMALLSRMRALGDGEWVFHSQAATPINPGNALKRYIRPAAKELGISMGGWHDLRHTLATSLRKRGYSPKVISELVGHSSVQITENIYDHADRADFRAALGEMASELLPDVTKSAVVN